MAKKVTPKEIDPEVESSGAHKKETYVTKWFKDNCPDNTGEVKAVCELTARAANEQFTMTVPSGNYEIFALIYFATFQSILEFLKEKEKTYSNYTIEICNSINIGYTNSSSTDNEKVGNFMPIMEYIGVNRTIVDSAPTTMDTTTQNFILWKKLNVKKNLEHYKEIQEKAYERLLGDYHTDLRTSEAAIPLFCIFMDNINNVLRMKFRELQGTDVNEVSMSVLGLFDAYYSFDEESGKEFIEYTASPFMKLSLKNDSAAGGMA